MSRIFFPRGGACVRSAGRPAVTSLAAAAFLAACIYAHAIAFSCALERALATCLVKVFLAEGMASSRPKTSEAVNRPPAPIWLAGCCGGRQHTCCQHLRAAHDAGSRQYTGGSQRHAPTPQTSDISSCCVLRAFVVLCCEICDGLCSSDILGNSYSSRLTKTSEIRCAKSAPGGFGASGSAFPTCWHNNNVGTDLR